MISMIDREFSEHNKMWNALPYVDQAAIPFDSMLLTLAYEGQSGSIRE